jgi:hypothetical protein
MEKLAEKGVQWETAYTYRLTKSAEKQEQFLDAVDRADILVLASPLYIDSIPSYTIKAMESVNERRKSQNDARTQSLFVIINCGFPEASQNKVALLIYRQFARELDIEWAGGAMIGWGMAIGSRPLKDIGGMVRNLKKGLDLAADALVEHKSVPEEVETLTSKPFLPIFLVKFLTVRFGKFFWNKEAKKNEATKHMYDRPYQEG